MTMGWRTWAETFSGCLFELLLSEDVLLFIPISKDPIVRNGRLVHVFQAVCSTLDEQPKFGENVQLSSLPAHTSCPHFKILPLFS